MIQRIRDNWAILLIVIAIFSGGGTFAMGFQDLRQDVVANTTDRQLRQFDVLEAKAKRQKLTPKERADFCNLARTLGIGGDIVKRIC
tara:strand:+ start:778 stop:1038 length:261 start_codon:yes stop_codon:yes gene_type:complete